MASNVEQEEVAMETDDASGAAAEAFKAKGNEELTKGHYKKAVAHYSDAIGLNPSSAILYSNRAMANIKLESYGLAILDAEVAIGLDATYIKAYYRRGSANFALGKYKLALRDFKAVCKLKPADRDARAKLKACDRCVKENAFANAIEAEETKPISETLDIDAIAVDASYDGPRLPADGVVTPEFVAAAVERFRGQKLIHKKYVLQMLLAIKAQLMLHGSLMEIDIPEGDDGHVTVCGDVHGQFYDLMNIFELNGPPSADNPFLFNGDYVDRGSFSFEVVMTLFMYKLLHPTGVYLTRGNHESKNMNKIYGFEGEVKHKYDLNMMNLFYEVFCWLPLAATIGGKIFVVHGGLGSEDGVTLQDVRDISRNREPPDAGLMCDLMWADPQPSPGRSPSKRGVGLAFGPDVTRAFLETNDLQMIVRSHEVRDNGYEEEHGGQLVTVFSAPNYCDQMGNKGAFIRFGHDLRPNYTTFEAVPHPPIKPMAYASNMQQFGL